MREKLRTAIIVCLFILAGGGIMAADNVHREVLDNGITVIINENSSAPVAACNFWFRVGAAYENRKEKGLSHFLEHMMFKGTETRGLGAIDKEIKELGGYNNAFTSYDTTNYVIVLPSEHVGRALEIQFDAITSSVFDPKEIDKEREVILTELYRGLDNPYVFLWQKLMDLSFEENYKDPIIGFAGALKDYTRESVVDYYKKYYLPENLIIVVSGDIKKDEIMKKIKETFGTMGKRGSASYETVEEGVAGETELKFMKYEGQVESAYLAAGFNIPDALSEDIPKLEILARILAGSESSVLYQSIKENKELVDDVDADVFSGRFGGIFAVSANIRQGKFSETLENIFDELEKIKKFGPRPEDVSRIKSDLIREQAKENMKVENMAMNLGYFEALNDYNMYFRYYDNLKRVIASDIKEVAEKYMKPEKANVVLYSPEKENKSYKRYKDAGDIKKYIVKASVSKPSPVGEVSKQVLKNGITLIHKKLDNTDIVSMRFIFKGGVIYEGGAWEGWYKGITNLMMETMIKGVPKMNAKEIAEELDSLGAVFAKDIKKDNFGWSAEVVNRNFEPLMELISKILIKPRFELSEIRKEKREIISRIKKIKDSPASYAMKLFNEEFFEWHPYGYFIPGTERTIKRTPSRHIKEWHKRYVTPNNLILSVAGNIDAELVKEALGAYFSGWEQGRDLNPDLPVKITGAKKTKREKIKKKQSHIIIGFLGPKTSSKDYYAFRVLDTILSGGMDSRLFTEVRDKRNLCYTIYSTFDRFIEKGAFKVYTATSPENEEKAADEILKVLKDVKNNGVTEEEIKSAKSYINGMFKIGLQDYMAQADSYAMYELWGIGYKKVDEFLDNIYKVDKKDIEKVIKKYFKLNRYTKVMVGP